MRAVVLSLLAVLSVVGATPWDPDEVLNVTQMIRRRGYPVEEHTVVTRDGFSLSVQRLPRKNAQPVVLVHGFLDCSTTWVVNGPNQSLAYILFDAGFDVWLGNNRGNVYSPPPNANLWNFSFDQMAKYDLPAFHDYVRAHTGGRKTIHVGHSEGTQQAFAGFSINPTLSANVKLFVALAPVAQLTHQDSLMVSALSHIPWKYVERVLGTQGVPPTQLGPFVDFILQWIVPGFCQEVPVFCKSMIIAIAGCNSKRCDLANLNATRVPVYSAHLGGSSMQNLNHYMQIARSPGFHYFDYGAEGNEQHYGQPTPPVYNVTRMTVDLAVFTGGIDAFADPQDVEILLSELPKQPVFRHNEPSYTHLDPIWGMNAHERIYPDVVRLCKQYSGRN